MEQAVSSSRARHRAFLVCVALMFSATAQAQVSQGVVKIGVLSDMTGMYAPLSGKGSIVAAQLAVEDSGVDKKGLKVEIVSADHQNKPDVGSAIVRKWYDDDKVDVVVDVPTSSVALAVSEITREKGKALLASSAGSSDLTGKACSPNTIHWTYDTWALANGTGAITVLIGGKSWSFLTADYAFGQALQRDTEAAVIREGGTVVEKIAYPFPVDDIAPYVKKAHASKAKIIGLANAGADTVNAIKIGSELGIGKNGQQFAGLLVFITDIHALGLEKTQGLLLTSAFYWDMNAKTRAWSQRFFERHKQMPTMAHAGVYASVLHYLKAVEALQSDDGTRVVAKMKDLPVHDPLFGFGRIRLDGRKIHNMYLFEVKAPSESKGPWDYYKLRGTIPAYNAFRPPQKGICSLVK